MDPDTRYLVGYFLGDGMIRHYRKSGYEVKLTEKDKRHVNHLAKLMERTMNVKPTVTRDRHRRAWRLRIYRKDAYEKMKFLIDGAIKEVDAHLIGGLFDAEGDYTRSKRRLRFTNKNPYIIGLVAKYLDRLGIKYSVYERRRGKSKWYTLEIYGENTYKLLPHLDLRHPKWAGLISSRS